MLRQTVVVSIAGIGMALIIIHGGIDLSVGSTVAFATVVVAKALQSGASPHDGYRHRSRIRSVRGVR